MTSPLWNGLTPPYSTVVADPPWEYPGRLSIPGGNRPTGPINVQPMTFSTMRTDEVAGLPVRELAATDASLFLWTTSAYLPAGMAVMASWGFAYQQTLVWRKTGNPTPFGGRVAPNHAEFLLVGTVGRPPRKGRVASSVWEAPKMRQHSRKPALFGDLIEQVSHGPYVELFARAPRLGWDSWGFGYEIGAAS